MFRYYFSERLELAQVGPKCHYVIQPINPITKEEFIRLLKTIKLSPV